MLNVFNKGLRTLLFASIAIFILWPLHILGFLIPKKLHKLVIWLVLIGLFYKFVYPRQDPLLFTNALRQELPEWRRICAQMFRHIWEWLDDETNATFLAATFALIGLFINERVRRSDLKRRRQEDIAKVTPRLTVRFTLSEGNFVCTIINLGGGTALQVRFTFMVVGLDDVLGLRQTAAFDFILPDAKDPRVVSIQALSREQEKLQMGVILEYDDILDRRHRSSGYGGQSSDGEFMSVGEWQTTTSVRGKPESRKAKAAALLFFETQQALWFGKKAWREVYYPRLLQKADELDRRWKLGKFGKNKLNLPKDPAE